MKLLNALLWSSLMVTMAPQAWAQANTIPSQPHLLVKGEAQRTVMPDRFSVEVELESVDAQSEAARRRVQGNSEQVLQLFSRHHALPDTVRADNLSIAPSTRYRDDEEIFEGIKAARRLSAEFATAEALRDFLGDLKASREVQVRTRPPTYAGIARLRAELKSEAAAQTRASARGLASAYGAKITGLYSISDVAPSFAYGVQAGTWPDQNAAGPAFRYSAGEGSSLDRVEVTGARALAPAPSGELLTVSPITYTENVYAIFLISDGT